MSRGSVTFRRTRDGGKEHCGPAFTRAGGVQSFKAGIFAAKFFLFSSFEGAQNSSAKTYRCFWEKLLTFPVLSLRAVG